MTAQRSVRSLDLNLLVTLDALLRLRNVTHAAAELRLSQPAVSAALGRLRRHFADDLLMRRGNRFELTPLAASLLERTPLALAEARRIFDASPSFDPGTARREFTVMMSDYAAVTLAPLLARRVAAAAPGVKLRLPQPTPAVIDRAPDALRALDGVVLPHGFLSGLPHADLFEDTWACIVSSDNDEVGERLTVAQLATLPWVVLMDRPTAYSPAAQQLRLMGIEPHVEVIVDVFLAMPFFVEGSRRVALVQRHLLPRLRRLVGIRAVDCPQEVLPLVEAFWWHPTHTTDPGHQWLRRVLEQAARELAATIDGGDEQSQQVLFPPPRPLGHPVPEARRRHANRKEPER